MKNFFSGMKFDPQRMDRINQIILQQADVIIGKTHSLKRADFMPSKDKKAMKITKMIKLSELPKFFKKVMPNMQRSNKQAMISSETLVKNPKNPLLEADQRLILEIEQLAKDWNCTAVGYAKVPEELIFQKCGIVYHNAIVLTMEMDRAKIALAPSIETMETVFQSYADLGEVVNLIADKLRERGYGAHAGPAIGGSVFYPELAQLAGLGYRGRSGMLISPVNGSRQRIAAVYTSMENLPVVTENKHQWVKDFCAQCGKCVKNCPAGAIYEQPEKYDNNEYRSYINGTKCQTSFMKYGCSICIKVCPFATVGYEKLKAKFLTASA